MTNDQWLNSIDVAVTEEHRRLFARNRRQGWHGIKDALNETRETGDPDLVPYSLYMEASDERDTLKHKLAKRTQLAELAAIAAIIGWVFLVIVAVIR